MRNLPCLVFAQAQWFDRLETSSLDEDIGGEFVYDGVGSNSIVHCFCFGSYVNFVYIYICIFCFCYFFQTIRSYRFGKDCRCKKTGWTAAKAGEAVSILLIFCQRRLFKTKPIFVNDMCNM